MFFKLDMGVSTMADAILINDKTYHDSQQKIRRQGRPAKQENMDKWDDEDHSVEFPKSDEAWTAMQEAVSAAAAEKYHGISLTGYSLTGCAETRLATVSFE